MMIRKASLVVVTLVIAACGGGTTTSPSPPSEGSLLTGVWRGTMTYQRDGLPVTTAPTTWTFELMPLTGGMGFTAHVEIQDAWLPATATLTVSLVNPQPGGHLSTQGEYASPRGCLGVIGVKGTAWTDSIDASLEGSDCLWVRSAVFAGSVSLLKLR